MVPGSQPSKRKARRHSFRTRMKTNGGRRVVAARRRKGRASLAKVTHCK